MEIPITTPNENGVFTQANDICIVNEGEWNICARIAYDGTKYYYGYTWMRKNAGGSAPCSIVGSCNKPDFLSAMRAVIMQLVNHAMFPQKIKTMLLEKRVEYSQILLF